MDKAEEVIIYAQKQEVLLLETIRKCLNHELTIEVQRREIERISNIVPVFDELQRQLKDRDSRINDLTLQVKHLELHLQAVSAPKQRKQRRKNVQRPEDQAQ